MSDSDRGWTFPADGERRVRQRQPCCFNSYGEPLYKRGADSTQHGPHSLDQRAPVAGEDARGEFELALDDAIARAYNQGCMHIQGDEVAADSWRKRTNESRAGVLALYDSERALAERYHKKIQELMDDIDKAREDEREACAALADNHECGDRDDFVCQHQNCGLCIAGAIRARGGK